MRLARTAIGLAAVGAGLLMARAISSRRGNPWQSSAAPEPPSPDQLIGNTEAHLSASEAAEAFKASRDRPV